MKFSYGIAFFLPKKKWTKTLMRMKLLVMLMLVSVFQLSASVSGQNAEVSMKLQEVSLIEFFSEVKFQTGFEFLYNHDLVANKDKVSVEVEKENLK